MDFPRVGFKSRLYIYTFRTQLQMIWFLKQLVPCGMIVKLHDMLRVVASSTKPAKELLSDVDSRYSRFEQIFTRRRCDIELFMIITDFQALKCFHLLKYRER